MHHLPLLLTGFAPFGTDTVNPSLLVAQALQGQRLGPWQVQSACLPTAFDESLQVLQQLLAQYRPAMVVCLGLAGGRSAMSFERIGININDARIPDNRGQQPVDTPVYPDGPAAYFSTLPIKRMAQAAQQAGVPSEVSNTAGTFVCNHILYGVLHLLAQTETHCRAGFVHVPWLPAQGTPCLHLSSMVRGLYAALWAAVLHTDDLPLPAGALH